jgi:hypothetical protein
MSQSAQRTPFDDPYGVSRLLHTLVLLVQRLPDEQGRGGHAAFFDAVNALMIDVCAKVPSEQAANDALVLVAIAQLERRPLGHDPLVYDLMQVLRTYGFMAGERGALLLSTLSRLVDRHVRLFWQESELPEPPAAAARSERPKVVDWNTLNLPWHLRPGQRVAALPEPNESQEPDSRARQPGMVLDWPTMAGPCQAPSSPA